MEDNKSWDTEGFVEGKGKNSWASGEEDSDQRDIGDIPDLGPKEGNTFS